MRRFFIVFILLSTLYVYLHIYIANFISRYGFEKSRVKFWLLLACLLSVSVFFLRKLLEGSVLNYFYFASFMWIGIIFVSAFIFIVSDCIGYLLKIDFKYTFYSALFLAAAVITYSIYSSLKFPYIKEIILESKKVSRDYIFYFLSDVHLDFEFKKRHFYKVMERINKENVDFIVIGGDFFDPGFKIDGSLKDISKRKVFFVVGNHEYYYGIDRIKQHLDEMNFENITSKSSVYGEINLIGLDDVRTAALSLSDISLLIDRNYKENYFNIVISHQPLYFEEISDRYDVVMLSAHTHCGQIFPFHIFTKLLYPYFCGRYDRKNSVMYVTSGASVWGPQMRFLSKNEILRVVIKKI